MACCKVGLSTTFVLVVLQLLAVVLLCSWYDQLSPYSSAPSNDKVHVLLVSSWRSGSTFLGQVFSQHPSVFYLMEPVWHVWTKLDKTGARALNRAARDLLWSTFQCDFSVMEAYLPKKHDSSSLFRWGQSRALCSPPICPFAPWSQFSNESQCFQACNGRSLRKVEETCNIYSHVVLKVVRLFDLESLYPLFQDPNLNLRVIHLVRDPRAVMRSREESASVLVRDSAVVLDWRNVPAAEVQYQVMQTVCHSHIHIIERAIRNPPPFLKGRYKMVRYEDIVQDPLEEINAMYEFVRLEMTEQMAEWIYKLTHGQGKGSKKEAFEITSRNAEDISQAWRTTLPHNKVQRIQEVCKNAMSLLGYRAVNSETEQQRLDIDLLVPQEANESS